MRPIHDLRVWTYQHLQTTELITKAMPKVPKDWELVNVRPFNPEE